MEAGGIYEASESKRTRAKAGERGRGRQPAPTTTARPADGGDSRPVLTRGRRAGISYIYIVFSQIEMRLKTVSTDSTHSSWVFISYTKEALGNGCFFRDRKALAIKCRKLMGGVYLSPMVGEIWDSTRKNFKKF